MSSGAPVKAKSSSSSSSAAAAAAEKEEEEEARFSAGLPVKAKSSSSSSSEEVEEGSKLSNSNNGDGRLSPPEVLEVLRAQLQCNWHAMAVELPKLWDRWDPNGDGFVEQHEMICEVGRCKLNSVEP